MGLRTDAIHNKCRKKYLKKKNMFFKCFDNNYLTLGHGKHEKVLEKDKTFNGIL